ncbi:MAG: Gfo/Idh/MocA family oxidoreductase, partial [Treponema sp.]|nr:Gfo/Idh/MocA family oxidoreductase [Treponema sp.]
NPGFRLIKEAIEQKLKLLEFVSFNIYGEGPQPVLSPSPTPPRNWHGNPKLAGGGIITHSTSHHLDLLRYTLGEVKSVSAHCRYIGDRDYYLLGRMEMENGVLVDMRLGRAELQGVGPGWNRMRSGGWDESVEAIGTGGYIKVESPTWQGYDPMTVKRWFTGMTGPEIFQVECDEQWTNELTAFAESCKTGVLNKTASSVVDGYKVDKIIETIHESNRQGGKKIDVVYEY